MHKYLKLIEFFESFDGKKTYLKFDNLFNFYNVDYIINFFKLNISIIRYNNLKNNFEFHKEQCKSLYSNEMNKNGFDDIFNMIDSKSLKLIKKYI